jgi:hypothetical protein
MNHLTVTPLARFRTAAWTMAQTSGVLDLATFKELSPLYHLMQTINTLIDIRIRATVSADVSKDGFRKLKASIAHLQDDLREPIKKQLRRWGIKPFTENQKR